MIKNIIKNEILSKKLKFPGRTVLRIESKTKKFFFFNLSDFLNKYCNNFVVSDKDAIELEKLYQDYIKSHEVIVHKEVEIDKIIPSMYLSDMYVSAC